MKTGIIGLSLSGKTTLFNALTGKKIPVGTGSREIHIANVKVPDQRIDKLSKVYMPKKTTFAEIDFIDFGGSFDSKTDNKTITKIKEMDCLAIVLGAYKVKNENEIINELKLIINEFIILDLLICEKRLERLQKEAKKNLEFNTLLKCKEALNLEKFISSISLSEEELKSISQFSFLTIIPVIVLINDREENYNKIFYKELEKICNEYLFDFLYISGNIEMEISELNVDEQKIFLADLGLDMPASQRFIRKAYKKMNLISFFTTGKDEVRAWTIKNGTNAQKAAGKIHSDIEKGFIRAETMHYDDFEANNFDESKVKAQGKLRAEGKNYIVKDGDIILFRFNV